MIVNGLVAIDHAIALLQCQNAQSIEQIDSCGSYGHILTNFLTSNEKPKSSFVSSLDRSVKRLASASQSMYMGSAVFQGPLRIDLIFL